MPIILEPGSKHFTALPLNYLHKKTPQPIIHRDISSANVLLQPIGGEERWMAKVLNSSTANFLRQTETERPGDVLYAAPEAIYPNQHSSKMDVLSCIHVCTCTVCNSNYSVLYQ